MHFTFFRLWAAASLTCLSRHKLYISLLTKLTTITVAHFELICISVTEILGSNANFVVKEIGSTYSLAYVMAEVLCKG